MQSTRTVTAMFGSLPSEQHHTLGLDGEVTPEANPWAVRWVADLQELEPYDVRRVGCDVRALFAGSNWRQTLSPLTSLFCVFSLSVQVPPWGFQEAAGHPTELSEEGVPQWRCRFDAECEACFGSFQALATHVLRHHRQLETVSLDW